MYSMSLKKPWVDKSGALKLAKLLSPVYCFINVIESFSKGIKNWLRNWKRSCRSFPYLPCVDTFSITDQLLVEGAISLVLLTFYYFTSNDT